MMSRGTELALRHKKLESDNKSSAIGRVLLIGKFPSFALQKRGVCAELARRLSESGWSVLTTSAKNRRFPRLLDIVSSVWRMRHKYDVAQVDVFSGLAFFWAEAACWTLRRARKPYVLTLHGGNLPEFSRRWPGRVRRLLQSADLVTTPSLYLQEQMRPYRNGLRELPNALDVSAYEFRSRRQPQPRLVWLRSFHEMYNPTLAPKVVHLLSARFPDMRLIMVGPDHGDGSLRRTQEVARELGVSDRIQWPGGVPKTQIAEWINSGDVFLNTTNIDNTPVSVLEAMACGLCVVSTNVGGVPYLLEHERDALLVPPADAQAMADAVHRILTEPELGERLSRQARSKAEQRDWSTVLPRWEKYLAAVAHGVDP
jgi:glycosyltransferase involved in cell wall biosynthesis